MIARGRCAAVRIPTPYSYFFRWDRVGMRYERVLPDPVGEVIWCDCDCFLEMEERSAYCMKVGVWMLFAYKNLKMVGWRGKCEKEGKRRGACFVVKEYIIMDKVCLDCSLFISILNHY